MTDLELLEILHDITRKQLEMKALIDSLVEDYAELISSDQRPVALTIQKIYLRAVELIKASRGQL